MSIQGELDDISLPDLIQAIAQTNRSGKLKLTSENGDGMIVFRQGKIIYAASSSGRETLGSLLLCRNLITEIQLVEALDRQTRASRESRLGTILVDMGAVSEASVEEVVFEQTTRVITEFMGWTNGRFKFDRMEIPDHGEVELDAKDFFVDKGMGTQHLLLEIAKTLDEMEAETAAKEEPDSGLTEPESAAPSQLVDAPQQGGSLGSLRSLIGEIRSPEFTGELSKKLLRFADELFEHSALFLCRKDGFRLMTAADGHRPTSHPSREDPALLLPSDETSLLSEAARRREMLIAPLGRFAADSRIAKVLDTTLENDAVAAPLTVNDKVLLVLYGDTLRERSSPRWRDELELLLLQAAVSMEKALVEKRIEYYEHLRREARSGSASGMQARGAATGSAAG